jgi:RNA polymerase sigma-70 factor (ECF subfamily)
VAAIQRLPARQRAVLLLRDVLGWSAAEAAALLDTTSVSINSALQRARATLAIHLPSVESSPYAPDDEKQRALLDRYVTAWQATDIDRFVAVLREDATVSMPPWPHWYKGRESIAHFFTWAWRRRTDLHIVRTSANGQPAFLQYARFSEGGPLELHGLQVLTVTPPNDAVSDITVFLRDPKLLAAFNAPRILES